MTYVCAQSDVVRRHAVLACNSLDLRAKNKLAWYENNQSANGGVWAGFQLNGLLNFLPGSPIPAIQLNSTSSSVPEPASGMLFGGGLLLLRFMRKKKSRKAREGTFRE